MWASEPKTFWDAVDFCKDIGGQLYGDIQSTSNIEFMIPRLGGSNDFWLGISDWEEERVFRNFRGVALTDTLTWEGQNPNNYDDAQNYVMVDPANDDGYCKDMELTLSMSFACQMIFSEWTEWQDSSQTEISPSETQVVQTRTCIGSQIGNPLGCVGAAKRRLTYLWNAEAKTWDNAKEACELQSARLFDDVDGSYEQMYFLVSHMGAGTTFWIGMSNVETTTAYGVVNMQSQIVDSRRPDKKLLWAGGQPSHNPESEFAACAKGQLLNLNPSGQIIFSEEQQADLAYVCLRVEEINP